ncbi:MAG TPA: S8 family serine peptidase [Gaiellaceae bacterium]|nr:S8 family serine peptidase [Gaiellaceae bacterium]
MRTGGQRRDVRASALWGNGKRGTGSRSNALWGSGKRRTALLATLVLTLVVPLGASAVPGQNQLQAFVAPTVLASAQSRPADTFSVIVQGKGGNQAAHAVADVLGISLKNARSFSSIDGVAVDLTGAQILAVAADKHVTAITADARVRLSAAGPTSKEKWPFVTGVQKYWAAGTNPAAPAATIAVVDSGIEASRPEFAGRIVANVNLTSLSGNSAGDGRGHGTFVAGIAAGDLAGKSGAAPGAKLVSLDVMDDQGMARTSDVIAAADWILANQAKYGIRVANFSLHSSVANSFMYDPLDKAVERLWFNNVVVVVAAGNYGKPDGPSGVPYAPGNDPFVLTVGASDTGKSVSANDDVAAPWSAYGYTLDGFAKPDLAAPGRYMIGPVPVTSTLYAERPDHVVEPGYMELSGTSFAAPIVSGVAALILGRHPEYTSDQVKAALMLGAKPMPRANDLSEGVGEVNAARSIELTGPLPNPNLALNAFVVTDPISGAKVFDAASWAAKAKADASWANASWADASWASASWSAASWASVSWAEVSFASASWADSATAAASWADLSLGSASWADNAEGEAAAPDAGAIDPLELEAILAGTLDP